nr:unnamed protein product [Callosobruchus analis]
MCSLCDSKFYYKQELNVHLKTWHIDIVSKYKHYLEDKIMCPKCGKKYPRLQLLTHVQFECGKQTILQCPLCPRKCKRDDILQFGHACTRCGNVYTRIDNFRRHQKYVCGMQPQFHCSLCNYSTKYKYATTWTTMDFTVAKFVTENTNSKMASDNI